MGYPTIKLTRFDGLGRSTGIWLALHIADIPFEDESLTPEEWETFRSRAPFAQSPIMTVNGTVYAQASALLRFVGNIAGLLPANPILSMAVDEIVAGVDAFFTAYGLVEISNLELSDRRRVLQAAYDNNFQTLFDTLNHLAGQQTKGFAVGDQLTIADLALFGLIDSIKRGECSGTYSLYLDDGAGLLAPFTSDTLDRFENLGDLYKNVSKQPKVAEWMASWK